MLYGKHLGLKGSVKRLREEGDPKLAKLEAVVDELKAIAPRGRDEGAGRLALLPGRGGRQPDHAALSGDRRAGGLLGLPRQNREGGLSLADYVLPGDHVALFVTTAGEGVRERVEEWKHQGEYLKSHAFAALALETAEAAAEYLHACIAQGLGLPRSGRPRRWRTSSPPATAASATASATPPARTSPSSASCSRPCAPRRSASTSPKGT